MSSSCSTTVRGSRDPGRRRRHPGGPAAANRRRRGGADPSHQWPTGSVLSAKTGPPADAGPPSAARSSSKRTTTPNAATTARRSARCKGWPPTASSRRVGEQDPRTRVRLGWFVMPERLAEPMAAAKIAADRSSPALEQFALADLITRGEFDRHLRRMRPVYRRRRDVLLTALDRRLPLLEPTGVSAGLHLVTWLPHTWTRPQWSTRPHAPGWASRASRPPGSATRSRRPHLRLCHRQRAGHRRGRRHPGTRDR